MSMMNTPRNRTGRRAPGNRKMAGLTLVELMIAIVLGMIVIAGVIQVFVGSVRSNSELLRMTRLEEELSAVLTLVSSDVRRAGYNSQATNPANVASGWVNTMAPITVNADEDCILYSYDTTGDGNAALAANRFGFRLNGTTIEMYTNTNAADWDCDAATGWAAATSTGVVEITALDFELTNQCVNATNSTRTCAAGSALTDDALANNRILEITIQGRLSADPMVARVLEESVKIRNDLITIEP
jgi:prepilin peptidase dependent protein B